MNNPQQKECNKCHEVLPSERFSKRSQNLDGLEGECRQCKKRMRAIRKKNNDGKQSETGSGKLVNRFHVINQELTSLKAKKNTMDSQDFLNKYTEQIEGLILRLAVITGNNNHSDTSNRLKDMAWSLLELNYNGYLNNKKRKEYQKQYYRKNKRP